MSEKLEKPPSYSKSFTSILTSKRTPKPKKLDGDAMPATASKSVTRRAPGVKISARRGPEPGNEYFSYCVDGAFLPLDRLVARFGDEGMAAVAKFDERERVTWDVAKAVPVPNDEGVWRLSFTGYPVEFDDDTCVRDADRAFYLGLDIAMETFTAEQKGGARAPVLVPSAVPEQTVQVRLRESVVPVPRASASPEVRKLRFSRFLVTFDDRILLFSQFQTKSVVMVTLPISAAMLVTYYWML